MHCLDQVEEFKGLELWGRGEHPLYLTVLDYRAWYKITCHMSILICETEGKI